VAATLPPALRAAIVRHARETAPYESCGVVVGDANGRALRYHPLRNIAGRLDWFEPDPAELLRAFLAMDEAGETLWAVCHSHPRSPARPSPSDIEGAAYPDSLYLICSLLDAEHPDVRAYRIAGGQATEVPLHAGG
jgi:proteasome lid subunit RPN8/RPN11